MTVDELFALAPKTGFDQWLFAGELVERWNGFHSPAHASTVATLCGLLHSRCCGVEGKRLRVLGSGCPHLLAHVPDTVVSFDASVIAWNRATRSKDATHLEGPPLLAIEVLEVDEESELVLKLVEESLRLGVPSLWVVDPFEELVICHQPGTPPRYFNGRMQLSAGSDLPGFRCSVAEIFE